MSAEHIVHGKKPTAARPTAPQSGTGWLIRRAMLAVVLMIGFYLFAVAIALGLLWIPYAEFAYVHRIQPKLALVCVGAALAILWALVPRPDRFAAPGPRLDERTHPKLFGIIDEVAAATGQEPPADVYLLNEVNAWVAQRGGTMGVGSHRVMGIGLPLLQAVTVPEFKAIIAHEFGHYSSGDVKIGPWIYRTRAAIGRTIAGVRQTAVRAPFLWYGRQFLKLTHAVSRQQEFIADRIAARVAGRDAAGSALRRVTAITPLFSAYVGNEVVPVLRAGFVPPIAAGFEAFLKSALMTEALQKIAADAEADRHTDPYDTHPALPDRLVALGCRLDATVAAPASGEPASALLSNPEQAALSLIRFGLGDKARTLKPIAWDGVGDAVFAAGWKNVAANRSKWLCRFVADALPGGRQAFITLGSELVAPGEENVAADERIARAAYLLGVGVGVLLLDTGWQARSEPGTPVLLVKGSQSLDPLASVRGLADGSIPPDEWRLRCEAMGIAGRPLAAAAAAPAVLERESVQR
ncbi:MAG TPA: M48 family metallopeptidase [Vicinamibacterales bacterium]